ncbi:HNT1 [[Candida] subhashii]|uniref:HNT1 n=1 Tax=[Candida] subhashii TaxID=561895 RepID=A0A8J5UK83_9ASCO|nr:HNT1 [[Candida] subhashii]KAG7665238.1 HNT1 [[Candida] subhashii]
MASNASCIFCKIIKGEIPCFKLLETSTTLSFLDIQPTAHGHVLVIPKYHAARFHNIPDEYLTDTLPMIKKLTKVLRLDEDHGLDGEGYNILQNNGKIAHQEIDHVHFHLIPKKDAKTGLSMSWPAQPTDFDALGKLHKELLAELEADQEEKL